MFGTHSAGAGDSRLWVREVCAFVLFHIPLEPRDEKNLLASAVQSVLQIIKLFGAAWLQARYAMINQQPGKQASAALTDVYGSRSFCLSRHVYHIRPEANKICMVAYALQVMNPDSNEGMCNGKLALVSGSF